MDAAEEEDLKVKDIKSIEDDYDTQYKDKMRIIPNSNLTSNNNLNTSTYL